MTNPSPVIFAGVLASKVRKIKIEIQSQRDEASQRLVKHNITISLHTFLKTCSACLFDINGRREVYLKVFQHVVAKHIHVSMVSFLHSLYCCCSISAYSFHDYLSLYESKREK